MKKVFLIITAVLALGATSCKKYLDQVPDDVLTTADIFKSRGNLDKFMANMYYLLPNEHEQRFTGSENSGPWTAASDESKYTWSFNFTNNMNLGAWSGQDGVVSGYWSSYYIAIRNTSYLIQNIDGSNPLEINEALRTRYKAEARGLRAMFYYFLVRTYGPVIMLGEAPVDINASSESLQYSRSPMDTCINFIVSELDKAAAELPATPGSEYGRVTSAVAKAYKVEALLLNASPLWNGNADYAAMKNKDGVALANTSYDATKWEKAATAAKEFLDTYVPGQFALYKETGDDDFESAYLSCRDVMLDDWNKEWIYARSNSGSYMRYDRTPFHVGLDAKEHGAGAHGATQAIVDAYFMNNGLPITDAASGYSATGFTSFQAPFDVQARTTFNMWVNREPRFYVGITYNNSYWLWQQDGGTIITNFETTGNSGRTQSTSDVSPTGYVVRKDVQKDYNDNSRGALLLRLANIYLDYAEALNESNPASTDILKYLNLIRERAGVPQYGTTIPVPASQAAMRDAIRAERRVELAFENVRYFDVRRWKIADVVNNGPVYGMNMFGSGNAFYTKTLIETRVFKAKDYLFPIPTQQILINPNLVQNPGWQ